ncbi:MAG: phosphatidylserine/phosphatidylglycerophosphate/cardiolipin synthase family protein [Eubacterium sp.]
MYSEKNKRNKRNRILTGLAINILLTVFLIVIGTYFSDRLICIKFNILLLTEGMAVLFIWCIYILNLLKMHQSRKHPDKLHKYTLIKIIFKSAGISVLVLLIYLMAGAMIPYSNQPFVTDMSKINKNVEKILDNSISHSNERIKLVSTNIDALTERLRMINMAEDSIILSTFDFRADYSGTDVICALYNAAQRGVKISILVDGISECTEMDGEEKFIALASHPNVEIKTYNVINVLKPWNLMGRMHDKYLIIDDRLYLLGGRNMYDYFLGEYPSNAYNSDMEVLVYYEEIPDTDSSINDLKKYFNEVWNLKCCQYFYNDEQYARKPEIEYTAKELEIHYNNLKTDYKECFEEYDYVENTYLAENIVLLSNPTTTKIKEPWVWESLSKIMQAADEKVIINTPYIICDDNMYDDLNEIVRGSADVSLIINAPERGSNPFGCSDYLNNKKKIYDTGITIYEYLGNMAGHSKTILIDDDISIIGSFNVDMRSTYIDTELMLVIRSNELNEELNKCMSDMEKMSKRVISDTEYFVPDNIDVPQMKTSKKVLINIIKYLGRPFRFLM